MKTFRILLSIACLIPCASAEPLRFKLIGTPGSPLVTVVASGMVDATNGINAPNTLTYGGYGNFWRALANSNHPLSEGITLTNQQFPQSQKVTNLSFFNGSGTDGMSFSLQFSLQGHPTAKFSLAGTSSFNLKGGVTFDEAFPQGGIFSTDQTLNPIGIGPLLEIEDSTATPAEVEVKVIGDTAGDPVHPGTTVTITVQVTNSGGRVAENVGLSFDATGWNLISETETNQSFAYINPGDSRTIEYQVRHPFTSLSGSLSEELRKITATAAFDDANLENNTAFALPISGAFNQQYGSSFTNTSIRTPTPNALFEPLRPGSVIVDLTAISSLTATVVEINGTPGIRVHSVERDDSRSTGPYFTAVHVDQGHWIVLLPPSPAGSLAAMNLGITGDDGAIGQIEVSVAPGTALETTTTFDLGFANTDPVELFPLLIFPDADGDGEQGATEKVGTNVPYVITRDGEIFYTGQTDLQGECSLYLPEGLHEITVQGTTTQFNSPSPPGERAEIGYSPEEVTANVGVQIRHSHDIPDLTMPRRKVIELELYIFNKGPASALDVTAEMTLPEDLELVLPNVVMTNLPPPTLLPENAGVVTINEKMIQVNLPILGSLEVVVVRVPVFVASYGSSILLSATAIHSSLESYPLDNAREVSFPVNDQTSEYAALYDLETKIKIDIPPGAEGSSDGMATISVTNNSLLIASNVLVRPLYLPGDYQVFSNLEPTRAGDEVPEFDDRPGGMSPPFGRVGLLLPGETAPFKLTFKDLTAEEDVIRFLKATCSTDDSFNFPIDANPENDTEYEFYRVGGHADITLSVLLDTNGDGVGDTPATGAEISYTDSSGNTVFQTVDSEGNATFDNILPAPGAVSARHPSGINPLELISPEAGTNNFEIVIPVGNTVQPELVKGEEDPLLGVPQIWFCWDPQRNDAETSKNLGDWTNLTNPPFLLNPTTIVDDQPVKPNCGFVRTSE